MRAVLVSALLIVGFSVPHVLSQPSDGMVVEGLRGTIPQAAASQAIEARRAEMIACVTSRRAQNDLIGGTLRVDFIIATNGTVRVARLEAGDLGDRDAEKCILRVSSSVRFPQPSGGEANVHETLRFPLDPDVRPALSWRPERVTQPYGSQLSRIAGRCRISGGTVRVTAYVGRRGRVADAGAFASVPALDAKLDCVVSAVEDLVLADPGSYPAKVSFDLGG